MNFDKKLRTFLVMLNTCELYLTDVMKDKRHGPIALTLKIILRLLSWPYRFIVFLRNWAYDHELLRQYQPPVPVVISIGNLVVGGSGKTPLTLLLAKSFYDESTLAIISRGYRSPAEKLASPITLSAGKGPLHSAAYCGDEAYLLADNLPKAFVFVGKDRLKSSSMAANAGVDIAFLDDAMQHRRIARDYEVVVMEANDPFGKGFFFPRGLLRESPKSLVRAHLIVLTGVENHEIFQQTKERIRTYTPAPVVGTRVAVTHIYDLEGNEVPSLKDKRVAIFCGIAHPERIVKTVTELGANVVAHRFYRDHHFFHSEEIVKLATSFQKLGAEMLVCTEKDKVKISEVSDSKLPIVWIKIEHRLVAGEQEWENFIKKVKVDLAERT